MGRRVKSSGQALCRVRSGAWPWLTVRLSLARTRALPTAFAPARKSSLSSARVSRPRRNVGPKVSLSVGDLRSARWLGQRPATTRSAPWLGRRPATTDCRPSTSPNSPSPTRKMPTTGMPPSLPLPRPIGAEAFASCSMPARDNWRMRLPGGQSSTLSVSKQMSRRSPWHAASSARPAFTARVSSSITVRSRASPPGRRTWPT